MESFETTTMSSACTEIKLQGLGGQGVVVAVEILAAVMSKAGYHVQSFSQYGAERRGGLVESYLRIAKGRILPHSRIYGADYLVLTSKTLLKDANIMANLKDGGVLFVNAAPSEARAPSGKAAKIIAIDADRIAARHGVCLASGMPIINTTVVGGLIALFPDVPFDLVKEALQEKRIPAVEKNIAAAQEAYRYVKEPGAEVAGEVKETGQEGDEEKESLVFRPGLSPCEVECPAGVKVREVLAWMQKGKMHKAYLALKAENPLPGISGRACFHPCEKACNRGEFDETVGFNAIERALSDHNGNAVVVRRPRTNAKQVAVIGSGPAGLSCASFLQMMGHRVTVFEALPVAGGIPRIGIPAYRLPRDVVDREVKNVIGAGIELKTGEEVDGPLFHRIMTAYDACFAATGAHQPVRLNIPGENSPQVMSGLEFLKRVALGEQAAVKGKVGVIGGGNTAIDAARTAKRLGASEVVIIYRRSPAEMPAHQDEVRRAQDEGISIAYLTAPVRIHADGGRIDHVECVRMALLDTQGKDGRKEVQPVSGSAFAVEAEHVITAIGEGIHVPFLPASVRKNGPLVDADPLGRTSLRGLYAGGDLTALPRSIAHAIGSGKRAAIGIDLFLKEKEKEWDVAAERDLSMGAYLSPTPAPAETAKILSLADLNLQYFAKVPKLRGQVLAPETRATHFNEVQKGLSAKAALQEAARCFLCGACVSCGNCYIFCPDIAVQLDESMALPTVNKDLCKACGICINECPHGVIAWERG